MSTSDLCLMPQLTDLYPSRLPLTAGCCRFYLQGSCPYETCFDTHPKGAVDIEIEENATTFFVPDSDSEDE
jgi:hypothetical protein